MKIKPKLLPASASDRERHALAALALYWDIKRLIASRQVDADHGAAIAEKLAVDLSRGFPDVIGYSSMNVFYMRDFYLTYRDLPKVQPLDA